MEIKDIIASYKHKLKIQIRFKDIDQLGHVNNAVYFTYFETARIEYSNDIIIAKVNWTKTGMILANAEITYKRPVVLEDSICCYTKVTRFGTKSFDIENILVAESPNGDELCAIGKFTLVCMNYETKQTIAVPPEWVESIKTFEELQP